MCPCACNEIPASCVLNPGTGGCNQPDGEGRNEGKRYSCAAEKRDSGMCCVYLRNNIGGALVCRGWKSPAIGRQSSALSENGKSFSE